MDANSPNWNRQVIRAAQKLSFGQQVANPLTLACAQVLLQEFDPNRQIPGCSNSQARASFYQPAPERLPMTPKAELVFVDLGDSARVDIITRMDDASYTNVHVAGFPKEDVRDYYEGKITLQQLRERYSSI